jgi:cytoskeletal protein RodZ
VTMSLTCGVKYCSIKTDKWRENMTFAKNMGGIDRIARFIIGALLVVLAITGTIGVWGWIGIILVVTAFINFCPIYRVFGIKTCKDC